MARTNGYNSQAFTPEEVKKGLHLELIKYLLEYNEKSEKYYNDIHITTDGYCTIIEWVCECHGEACTGFSFVDHDEQVMKLVYYPDNSFGYAEDEDEANDMLLLWLRENPGWERNEYGHWYNKIEQEQFIKSIKGESDGSTDN